MAAPGMGEYQKLRSCTKKQPKNNTSVV
jgi:hypothetical protein